jgi:hypothetical protein
VFCGRCFVEDSKTSYVSTVWEERSEEILTCRLRSKNILLATASENPFIALPVSWCAYRCAMAVALLA